MADGLPDLVIRPERIQADIEAIARFTDPDVPFTRRAFSPPYLEARAWLAERFRDAGLDVHVDAAANLIGRRGAPGERVLMMGSHTDTVQGGGRFDGILGVMAALEVARALDEAKVELSLPLEVVDFVCEEPTIVNLSPLGSRIMAGDVSTAQVDAATTPFGERLVDAIAALGGDAARLDSVRRAPDAIAGYLELHIEQAPVLEREGLAVGVVTAIAAPCRARVTIEGSADHAGATMMNERRDALAGAAELVLAVESIAAGPGMAPEGVGTVGWLDMKPNMANVIPGRVDLTVEVRSIEAAPLSAARGQIDAALKDIASRRGLSASIEWQHVEEPVTLPDHMHAAVAQACEDLGLPVRRMPSRASHDAARLAPVAPAGMVFIRCKDGKSHAFEEWATLDDIAAGTRVLGQALLRVDEMVAKA